MADFSINMIKVEVFLILSFVNSYDIDDLFIGVVAHGV
jgi:hypothetical protein